MLDFKEIPKDGNNFELLVRELLLIKGYRVLWSGKGSDGGKDLLCYENRESEFINDSKLWLIQCKHKAHSGNSVGTSDLDDIVDSCNHHGAKGYLLVCSTYPSSTVVSKLEGITNNPKNDIEATYWDSVKLEQLLSTPKLWRVAQIFFPNSSKNSTWEIYSTEIPNHWIANYKGYHFHLTNRIGSKGNYHFKLIEERILDIQKIKLKKDHFIRIRAIYFDDKHGNYIWFLDYMYPYQDKPVMSSMSIAYTLGHESVLNDGQWYNFDVISRTYSKYSDHYDKDHYEYYLPYLVEYRSGSKRKVKFEIDSKKPMIVLPQLNQDFISSEFNKLKDEFNKLKCAKLVRAVNCQIEKLNKFNNRRDWSELIEEIDLNEDSFFNAWYIFSVSNKEDFFKMISFIPQNIHPSFRLTNPIIYLPDYEGEGSVMDDEQDMYELTISLIPGAVFNSYNGRKDINDYMKRIRKSVSRYIRVENEK
ncbi:restriction endonuclease [Flavobacterium rakeshii]|uniref:restriction endonuclease n=1 Tax=Flavobacterium rakeshii TaxID=1038845 RepID=UPI002E7B1915|nr:restriction endonuclease [Flavobacterium rakeshii]MEE1898333.1 restriction endonuclease [Flavobacterium rakeshii]